MLPSAPQDGDPAKLVGTIVAGRYRVRAFVGESSLSATYEVERVDEPEHRYALKVMLPQLGGDRQLAARFVREGKALGMFHHANIVELREVGVGADGMMFIVTDLVRGSSLRALIDHGPVEPLRALAIARQILDALGHAHALGVIHRDLRPETIVLVDSGDPGGEAHLVKILDFGVAKLVRDTAALLSEAQLTQTGITMFGSPAYMPPEAVLGRAIDPRADLYSVGVVVFELLTGAPPFRDPDPATLVRLHASAAPPTLAAAAPGRTFTPELELLVAEALAKTPELRFASASEMIDALDRAAISVQPELAAHIPPPALAPAVADDPPWTGQPVAAPPLPADHARPNAPRPRWMSRRIVVPAGAAVGLLIVILAIAAMRSGSPDATPAAPPSQLLRDAADLATVGNHAGAAELLERELASAAAPDGEPYLALGHARMALGRRLDAVAAYERAIALTPALAGNATIRAKLASILETKDTAAAVAALELLARGVTPPAHDAIVAQASTGKIADIRHRAFAIAEREGIADRVDRVESWSLDLRQAGTCEDRRTAIVKLRARADKRALPALRRIVTLHRCVEREATAAIAQLEAR